jgi:hypothetical protein
LALLNCGGHEYGIRSAQPQDPENPGPAFEREGRTGR